MPNTFLSESQKIATDFIQSIVFIDDEVYGDKDNQGHRLNQEVIMNSFAKKEKVCAVYNPKKECDLPALIKVSQKADVVILDWNMNFDLGEEGGQDDDEVDQEDPRGAYTLDMIDKILFDKEKEKEKEKEKGNLTGLKCIIIYTGEIGFDDILTRIYDKLKLVNKDPPLIGKTLIQ